MEGAEVRAAVQVFLCALMVATTLVPGARADVTTCMVNAVLTLQLPKGALQCFADNSPTCAEVFDGQTVYRFPCATPCQGSPPDGGVAVVVVGSQNDAVTGELQCAGVMALRTTATVGPSGGGVNQATGPLPGGGTAMACVRTGNVPASVRMYVVQCGP
jgi:hypothetical protein